MIRENYASLGGWSEEEYIHFWEGERRMESLISGDVFWTAIEKGMDEAERELKEKQEKKKPKITFKKLISWLWLKALIK